MSSKEDKVDRVVVRKGKTVRITTTVGEECSLTVCYELPSTAKARKLEKEANVFHKGYPSTISIDWRPYLMDPAPEETP